MKNKKKKYKKLKKIKKKNCLLNNLSLGKENVYQIFFL